MLYVWPIREEKKLHITESVKRENRIKKTFIKEVLSFGVVALNIHTKIQKAGFKVSIKSRTDPDGQTDNIFREKYIYIYI